MVSVNPTSTPTGTSSKKLPTPPPIFELPSFQTALLSNVPLHPSLHPNCQFQTIVIHILPPSTQQANSKHVCASSQTCLTKPIFSKPKPFAWKWAARSKGLSQGSSLLLHARGKRSLTISEVGDDEVQTNRRIKIRIREKRTGDVLNNA